MRIFILLLTCLCLLSSSALAVLPELSFPTSMEVLGNSLHSLAFVVEMGVLSPEVERGLRYSFEGFPAEKPPRFDEVSKLFYWRPEPTHEGFHTFTLVVKDPTGKKTSRSVDVCVLKAPSLEALPWDWLDLKKEDRYLVAKKYFPSSNIVEMDIAALPEYELEITVKNSLNEDCVLTYVPKEGQAQVNKGRRLATIMLGGKYAGEKVKRVRRDLYEDLFAHLGMVFKRIESVKLRGGYQLKGFWILDRPSMIAAFGEDNIYLPRVDLLFDDRLYQDMSYSKEDPMRISDAPEIKIEFNTQSGLIWRRGRLVIDKTEYSAARGEFSVVVVKPYQDVTTFDVNYGLYLLRISPDKKLPFGEHWIFFEIQNAFGMPVSGEAYVRVVTIPAQVEGRPVAFPSPFHPERDGEVKIQYRLTQGANIEIAIFGVDGSTKMKRRIFRGEEGARKGLNTISWDGMAAGGFPAPNGIYTGVIIDKDENRILEKFKITVYR